MHVKRTSKRFRALKAALAQSETKGTKRDDMSRTYVYVKPELTRTHVCQSLSRVCSGRSFGRPPPARRAGGGSCGVDGTSPGQVNPVCVDSGLAERSVSSGQKRAVSLFPFEDRETALAFDQASRSNIGRNAQAEGLFEPRNPEKLPLFVHDLSGHVRREGGAGRPAATSARALSATWRSTPCAPPPAACGGGQIHVKSGLT